VKHPRERLAAYCALLVSEPDAPTAVKTPGEAWALHVEDALAAAGIVRGLGPARCVDVGSGGGSPGIPLAVELGVEVVLLDAAVRRCRFLERAARAAEAPCPVVHARSEDHARGEGRDAYDVAFARALAPPPVAVELVLPLVRPGGAALLWTADVDRPPLSAVAAEVAGRVVDIARVREGRCLVVLHKTGPTPDRFPRRPGMAGKRPLARLPSPA
jgi:16S rRNA (guanine527-N7)-methyltransferase